MQLEPAQLEAVKSWLAEGASLSDVQKRIKEEFGVSMLYLDLRMLVLDIGATVKEPPKKTEPPVAQTPADDLAFEDDEDDGGTDPALPRVAITLDRIMKPGALVSGEAVFPGAQTIHWMLDRSGRVAIDQAPPGFAPTQEEGAAFQNALRDALMKNGYA